MSTQDVETEEVWESQVDGRTFAETRDVDNRPRNISTLGVGDRMRLMTSDRKRVQERIRESKYDPFRNGTLLRIDVDQQADPGTASPDALSEKELADVFTLDLDDFRSYVPTLGEVNLRRLKRMAADANASLNQSAFLNELIEERYRIGGDTPTYREMQAGPNTPS